MNNILMIIGRKNGSEIVYTVDHKVKVQKSKCKSTHLVFELGNIYHRPALATMKLIKGKYGYHQKIPIIVEMNRFLFFPTISYKDEECCWINYYCVCGLEKVKDGTIISFYDHTLIGNIHINYQHKLFVDKRVLVKQMKRCHEIHKSYQKETNWIDK